MASDKINPKNFGWRHSEWKGQKIICTLCDFKVRKAAKTRETVAGGKYYDVLGFYEFSSSFTIGYYYTKYLGSKWLQGTMYLENNLFW